MKRMEVIKRLTQLHDWLADGQAKPDEKQSIQALCEGIGWMGEKELAEMGVKRIMFLCDGRACKEGCNNRSRGQCKHTSNGLHARNFILQGNGLLIERDGQDEPPIEVPYNDVIVEV